METIEYYWHYLNEPVLVARFQEFCGITIGLRDSGLNSTDDEVNNSDDNDNDQSTSSDDETSETFQFGITENMEVHKRSGLNTVTPNSNHLSASMDRCKHGYNSQVTSKDSKGKENWQQSVKDDVKESVIAYSMLNNVDYKITNRFFYYIFCFGAMLGNEEFNCTFFPYWFWNVDGFVCRRVLIVWGFSMFFGQALKDILRKPRPSSPPVAKLEGRYELEYGFPSTHATIAITIPFSFFILTRNRYLYSWDVMAITCLVWSVLVCLSRIYLGMHSVLDVVGGAIFGIVFLLISFPFLDVMDNFQLTHPYAPIIITVGLLLLCLAYPSLDKWSTARGDSTMTLAVMCGVSIASWLAYNQGFYDRPLDPPPYAVKFPDGEFIITTAMRMAIGGTILIATRSGMKFIVYRGLCKIYGLNFRDAKNLLLLKIEFPYKFLTYVVVAFNVVYVCPIVFRLIGIERIIAFTDLNPA